MKHLKLFILLVFMSLFATEVEARPYSNGGIFNDGTGSGSGTGATNRVISSISTNTTGGAAPNTDYNYFVSGTTTFTLPTAVGNTNEYTVKRVGTNPVTIITTSSQTMDGSTTIILSAQYQSLTFISDNANWNIK